VADRDEQRPLVERVDDRGAVLDRDDLEPWLRLVEVAHGGEVRLLVHDPVPLTRPRKAREHDRLGDGHVLVHHDRAGRRAEDPGELVAHRDRHLPPTVRPRADAALAPGAAYSRRLSSAAAGIAASEWLIRYVQVSRIGKRSRYSAGRSFARGEPSSSAA
jgi:hypothetical protein